MRYSTRTCLSITALATLAACSADRISTPTVTTGPGTTANATTGQAMRFLHAKVCPSQAPGVARCHSWIRVDAGGTPLASTGPSGYGPADLQSAYALPTIGGVGQTIAIVDAFDDGNAEKDL